RIAETKQQDVLDGLFAKIVIDAEDLILTQQPLETLIERAGTGQVGAERFLDDNPQPGAVFRFAATVRFGNQPAFGQRLDTGHEQVGGGGQVGDALACDTAVAFDLLDGPSPNLVLIGLLDIEATIEDAL